MPIYIFNGAALEAFSQVTPGKRRRTPTPDTVQWLISKGKRVTSVKLKQVELRLDIGSPETLIEALGISARNLGMKNGQSH